MLGTRWLSERHNKETKGEKSRASGLSQGRDDLDVSGLEALPCGLLIFDRRDRLVRANDKVRDQFPELERVFARGTPYKSFFNEFAEKLLPEDFLTRREVWLRDKLEWHAKSGGVLDQQLNRDRWLLMTERNGRAGETVCLMLDISDLRRRDRGVSQARFLAQASQLLEAFSSELLLSVWGENIDQAGAKEGSNAVRLIKYLASNRDRKTDLDRCKQLELRLQRLLGSGSINLVQLDIRTFINAAISDHIPTNGAEIETVFAAGLWNVIGDQDLLEICVRELVQNAVGASAQGDTIYVECENVRVNREFIASRPSLKPIDYVRVRVRDLGEGMRPEVLSGALSPFFRGTDNSASRDASDAGFGLGLSEVHAALQKIGGYLELESQEGRGTSASLYLRRLTDNDLIHSDFLRETQ